ncbi:hypothetical protein MKW94_020880 [Papaver nudicaule]|uniref:protein-serine/threonine phosphatase n=1 Tax=Papaver nudicaule TaxID=74823 RepID=A0AA41W1K7_PAPNU|nr:hypothetical protein [Papaver nudicaule]
MGMCISAPSPKIQKTNESGENVIIIENTTNTSHNILVSVFSQQGTNEVNQDSALIYKEFGKGGGQFFGVFDGHGENGHKVSRMVIDRLPKLLLEQEGYRELVSTYLPNEWRRECVSAFKVMDRELKLQKDFDCSCSGTTAVTILKQDQDLLIANLGDSRAILGTLSENGELKAVQLTVDQKPDLPQEAERIRKCGGRTMPNKDEPDVHRVWSATAEYMSLAMTRSFGDFYLKDYGVIAIPQITHRRLTIEDQFLVLATDGVWDILSNEEVSSIIWSVENKEEAAQTVVEAAAVAWKRDYPTWRVDDITVVCLFLQDTEKATILTTEEETLSKLYQPHL